MALAVGMTRSWVALYTLGLPRELREGRRMEINCDLWEQRQLAEFTREPPLGTAAEIAARAVLGMLSDITWRVQARASTRADRSLRMNKGFYMRAMVAAAVVLALSLILIGMAGVAWYLVLVITIPLGIAMVAIAFFRARQTGGTVGIGVDRIRTTGKSRWKWLLLVIGVSVATVVGMWAYALSLEEWGEARTMIFNLGGLLAIAAGLIALVLLLSDLMGSVRRKTDG
ncbi:MAG: hypothetical protein HYY03_10170 [Chloroflexi bacterium]|nr:hypothetical protein [Chloroflexota bacterium]